MLRDRHLAWFLALAERAEPELGGPSSVAWQDRLELELDNLRAALAWSKILLEPRGTPDDVSRARPLSSPDVPVESEAGLRLAAALWRFWELRGHLGEGRARLTELLALASGRTAARAKALSSAGYLAALQGDYGATRALKEEAMMLGREVGYTLSARLPRWSLAGFPIARSRLS